MNIKYLFGVGAFLLPALSDLAADDSRSKPVNVLFIATRVGRCNLRELKERINRILKANNAPVESPTNSVTCLPFARRRGRLAQETVA
jgi:hypothetical protein